MQRAGKPACGWEADKRPYVGVMKRGHLSVVRDFETGGGLNQRESLAHHG